MISLAELDELEQHLTGESVRLAKAAIQRVFESVALSWKTVGPRRRERVRAEITSRTPFCPTVSTSIRVLPIRGATSSGTTTYPVLSAYLWPSEVGG